MNAERLSRLFPLHTLALLTLLALSCFAQAQQQAHVARLAIDGAIGPATTDYLTRSLEEAREQGARLAVIRIDTPGGLDAATRDIVKAILDSPIPIATYVHPAGARAASAGTYILYASHVAAMTPSTTLGAATPVQMGGGGGMPGAGGKGSGDTENNKGDGAADESQPPQNNSGSAMERKVVNDAVAFIRGLATRHGRNADWAEKAVREAATLTAAEALEQNVVDVVAKDLEDLLTQLDGMTVEMKDSTRTLATADLPVRDYEPDWRNELLALITNPQIAYILLLIGIYGLIFEGYSPGAMVPGVVGLICLLLGLYALQVLPINYAGLALIIAGALLIVAEAFVPSFGILGIGGVVALVFGSVMLIDTDVPEMMVSRKLIGGIAAASSIIVLALLVFVGKNLRLKRPAINKALVGQHAIVASTDGGHIQVRVHGELWRAHSESSLQPGQPVEIVDQPGLDLQVSPLPSE